MPSSGTGTFPSQQPIGRVRAVLGDKRGVEMGEMLDSIVLGNSFGDTLENVPGIELRLVLGHALWEEPGIALGVVAILR
jgi:hypothetical protein